MLRKLWYFFAALDGVVILVLWGRALLRSLGAAVTPIQYLHVGTEVALCIATVLSVCGLIRGSRFATILSASVLASLIYLCFHTPDVAGVAEQWSLQNSADFDAHQCAGELAARAARKIEEALWRQEHAKKIRRRV